MTDLQLEALKIYIDARIQFIVDMNLGRESQVDEDTLEDFEEQFDEIMLADLICIPRK